MKQERYRRIRESHDYSSLIRRILTGGFTTLGSSGINVVFSNGDHPFN